MTVWLVEDDENIRELVVYALKAAGYEAAAFSAAAPFYEALAVRGTPDALLLDIMLPDEDGLAILKNVRERQSARHLPVMMLTAKGEEYDKVLGLDAGADDYVAKPFGMMELMARVRALLRRGAEKGEEKQEPRELHFGGIVLRPREHTVTVQGTAVALTLKEFELLQCMMQSPGAVFTRDGLLENIWGYRYEGGTRTVDVHIRSLRQKLGDCGKCVQTVRGVGYKLGEEA